MSLKVWLPLDGDLHNQGASNIDATTVGGTVDSSGEIGSCYYLSSSSRIYTDLFTPDSNNFSMCCWYKAAEENTASGYIFGLSRGSAPSFMLYKYSTTIFRLYIDSYSSYTHNLDLTLWHHLTITYDGTTYKLYIDGEYKAHRTKTVDYTTNSYRCFINCRSNNSNTNGAATGYSGNNYYNDFRYYNHCLSPLEVKEIALGLILHYKLDTTYASNIIQDSSGYNHNGVITGTITLDNNSPKYAASSYVNGSSYILTPTGSFGWNDLTLLTISAWMKPTASMTGWRGSVGIAADANQKSRGIAITDYGNEFRGTYPNGSTYVTITTGQALTQNEWHHCAGTLNGTEFKLYFDGELVKTLTIDWGTATLNTNARFEVGVDLPGSDEKFTGNYSDVRLYCTPLLDTDIKLLYNNSMRIDNLQNIHTFELIENKDKIAITHAGQLYCDSLNEATATKFYKNLVVETTEIIER